MLNIESGVSIQDFGLEGLENGRWGIGIQVGRLKYDPVLHPLYGLVSWREVRPSEQEPLTCEQLLRIYHQNGGELTFGRVLDSSEIMAENSRGELVPAEVFNISGPFLATVGGENLTVVAFRCDPPGVEGKGEVRFALLQGNSLIQLKEAPILPKNKNKKIKGCEDPRRMFVEGDLFLGVVEVGPNDCCMSFSRDSDSNKLDYLREITRGPRKMKGIFFIGLEGEEKDNILLFGRFEEKYRFLSLDGKVREVTVKRVVWKVVDKSVVDNPKEFIRAIQTASPVEDLFAWGEWGGVNDALLLENGKVGVLGHVARYDRERNKHYYATTFEFDPKTGQVENLQIIASKENFPEAKGVAKRVRGKGKDLLMDVVYFNGMEAYVTEDEKIMIKYYGGAGDKVPVVFEKENHFSARPVRITRLPQRSKEPQVAA